MLFLALLRPFLVALLLYGATGPVAASAPDDAPPRSSWIDERDPVFQTVARAPSATQLVQTGDGFIWIATQSGLSRWDGHRLRTYAVDTGRAGGLPDGFITALFSDAAGRLWVGTNATGLLRYDPATDRFDAAIASGQALSRGAVFEIAPDRRGHLLIATASGLDRLDPATGAVLRHAEFARPRGLPDGRVNRALAARDGALWVGTSAGLFHARDDGRFEPIVLPGVEAGALQITSLCEDSAGKVWVGTRTQGSFVVDPADGRAVPLRRYLVGGEPPRAEGVFEILEAEPGEIWIGTAGAGILRVDTTRRVGRRIVHHEREPNSLPDDEVLALMRDRSGLVWAITDTALSYTAFNRPGLATWWSGPGTPHGLSARNVPALLAAPDGKVWLAVADAGIDVLDPATRRVTHLRQSADAHGALPRSRVLTMLAGPSGEVYIGTHRGLYRADADGRHVERLELVGRAPTAPVWALARQGSRLWVGGLDGLWGVEIGAAPRLPVVARLRPESMREPRVASLLPDGDGTLWVGTQAGVLHVDTASMQATPFGPADDAALARSYVSSLRKDAQGRLWIGLFGGGVRVAELDPSGRPLAIGRIDATRGLPQDSVDALLVADDGDVWVSTDLSISRIGARTLAVTSFDAADGVAGFPFWTGSAARTAEGQLLFGGSGGLAIVDPRRIVQWTYPAPLAVTEVRLGDAVPEAVAAAGRPLAVPLERRSVFVEFAALDYSAPQRNRYAYRLRGVDADWIATDATRRLAAYTNLGPGDYTLELRGSNRSGDWSEPIALRLQVPPAWHETTWFRALLAVLAVGVAGGLSQLRTVYLRRRQRVLETLVAQRTAALETSQRQLETMAYSDGLTSLANRRRFNDELRQLLALQRRRGGGFTLVLVDLDHFKRLNDTEGHDAGDAVLVAASQRLKAAVRESDTVARLGGDEFAALLPDTHEPADVQAVCERIVQGFAEPIEWRGQRLEIGASIGAACHPRDGADGETLYKAADLALYEAKRAGRNCWRLHAA